VAAFPEGWMSSGQISRDGAVCHKLQSLLMTKLLFLLGFLVSAMKKKLEKEAMEQELDE
jgi:hypothetical protein